MVNSCCPLYPHEIRREKVIPWLVGNQANPSTLPQSVRTTPLLTVESAFHTHRSEPQPREPRHHHTALPIRAAFSCPESREAEQGTFQIARRKEKCHAERAFSLVLLSELFPLPASSFLPSEGWGTLDLDARCSGPVEPACHPHPVFDQDCEHLRLLSCSNQTMLSPPLEEHHLFGLS